jgi:hypothetical protein
MRSGMPIVHFNGSFSFLKIGSAALCDHQQQPFFSLRLLKYHYGDIHYI